MSAENEKSNDQLPLLPETPIEEALLLPPEEVRKRYTAENAKQIEWRRKACVELLGMGLPLTYVARALSMNHHTVAAIACQEGQKVAVFSEAHSAVLATDAMSDLALARTRREEATYKDLHIGAGIKLTHSVALKMVGAGGIQERDTAIELESENEKLAAARKFVESLKPAVAQVIEQAKV